MIELIKKNINDVKTYFNNKKKICVFGKGPTFQIRTKKEDEYFACVNNTINYIDNCDILVCNDIETFDKINLERLVNLKFILCPYHIHFKSKFHKTFTYNDVLKKISTYFTGKLIVYNLRTSNIEYPDFTIIEFICKFLLNIKNIELYGVGVFSNSNYNKIFTEKIDDNFYNNKRINLIKNNIVNLCNEYNKKYIFN
jgi:hypothetical protein